MSEGFTESVTFKAEGLDAVVQAQSAATKSAAELLKQWAAGQAVLSRKTSGGFVADMLKHAKAADELRKATRARPTTASPYAANAGAGARVQQERPGYGGMAAASRVRDEAANAMKAAALSIRKSFQEGRKAWNSPPPEYGASKPLTRGQIAMSRVGNTAATVGAGVAAFGMSGFGGTVQGNRAQAEWDLVQRELAAAFLPALELGTKGLQRFRHFLEGLNSTGQNVVMGAGLAGAAHLALRGVGAGGIPGVVGGAASAAGWAGRRMGIGGAAAGAAGIAGVAAGGLPTAAAMAGVGTPGAAKKAMDMAALSRTSARGGSMNMPALSTMSGFPAGFPAQARGANVHYSASKMNMAALSAVAQPVAPPVPSRYAQLRSGIGSMASSAGSGLRGMGGAMMSTGGLIAGAVVVGGVATAVSNNEASRATGDRIRRTKEGRLDESEAGGLEESTRLAIQRNGGTEEEFRAKAEKDRVEMARRQHGVDAKGESIGSWSKFKAGARDLRRNLWMGGDLDAEDAKVRSQLEQVAFLDKKKTGENMIGGKDKRRLEIAGGGFESFMDTYQRSESAFGGIMGANAGGPQAKLSKEDAMAKALSDVAVAVKALADEQAKQKANEPGMIQRNA